MKTIISSIIALGVIAGIAAPVVAAPNAKSFFEQLDKERYNTDARTLFDGLTRDGR